MQKKTITISFMGFLFLFISCTQSAVPEITKSKTQNSTFDISQGFIKTTGTVFDTIHGIFAIDNGTCITHIDSAFFYSRLDSTKFVFKKNHINGTKEYEGVISVKIDNHVFTIKRFLVMNCNKIGATNVNGILGEELFIDKIVVIDFEKQIISFCDTIAIDSQYVKIPLLPPHPSPYDTKGSPISNQKFVRIVGQGKNPGELVLGHLQFDLGCIGADMVVKQSFIKRLKAIEVQQNKSALLATAQKATARSWMLDFIRIGVFKIKNIAAKTTLITTKYESNIDPMDMFTEGDGLLGLNVLKRFNLISDYKNNILYIKLNKSSMESVDRIYK